MSTGSASTSPAQHGISIRLREATVRFGGHTALRRFSGGFDPGAVTALIGGDGAGKSTLLRLLAGRLGLHGGEATGLPVDRADVGYQPAESGVWRSLSVTENIEFAASVFGLDRLRARRRASELLERAGLERVPHRLAGRLSGGMRQKLGVILATLHEPGLVLLDEPTSGVDPVSRAELWGLMADAAAGGATVVFATTYLDEAERASSLHLLGEGSVLAQGTPQEVIAQTPGTVWEAPAAGIAVEGSRSWRRGAAVYRWGSSAGEAAPAGFRRARVDLETTSIALLLDREDADGAAPGIPGRVRSGEAWAGCGTPIVQAEAVGRSFGAFTALDDVSLQVAPGEVVGLLGGNGAGKTTLMRILLGLDRPTEGRAALFGQRPGIATRRRVGYVAQGLGLYPSLSPVQNLEFAASVQRVELPEPVRRFARRLGTAPVSSLPLGAKRILAYLAASVHCPQLLVLDEPTSGMDALTRARLWRDLRDRADAGTGSIITTHYMQEAAQCDRLVLLAGGRVAASGSVAEITAGHRALLLSGGCWQEAFARLRAAGLPVLLDGRSLRVTGGDAAAVEAALGPLAADVEVTVAPATLEEAMMAAALADDGR